MPLVRLPPPPRGPDGEPFSKLPSAGGEPATVEEARGVVAEGGELCSRDKSSEGRGAGCLRGSAWRTWYGARSRCVIPADRLAVWGPQLSSGDVLDSGACD